MPTLILSRKDVLGLLSMAEVISSVEQAFKDWEAGRGIMPVKAYLTLEKGDFRAMPAALPGGAGLKWVNVHARNPGLGLPTVMAVIVCNDPETGYPLAVMDGTDLTAYRTGATSAIASKYLARKDARTIGIIGAGRQAYTQLLAHAELFDLKLVKVADIVPEAVARFIKSFSQFKVQAASAQEAARSDILCTVTTAASPVVKKEWVMPGTHINAIGADAAGKEELEPAVLKDAVVVVDDLRQSSRAGEINVPVSKGLFSVKDVYATIGEVIAGKKPGRSSEKAITIFDSTGLAIEDIAVANLLYARARESGSYLSVNFVEG